MSIKYKRPYLDTVDFKKGRATNVASTQKDQPLFSLYRKPHFETHERLWNEQKFGHGFRRGLKPSTTVLARASSNLLLHCWKTLLIKESAVSARGRRHATATTHGRQQDTHRGLAWGPATVSNKRKSWNACEAPINEGQDNRQGTAHRKRPATFVLAVWGRRSIPNKLPSQESDEEDDRGSGNERKQAGSGDRRRHLPLAHAQRVRRLGWRQPEHGGLDKPCLVTISTVVSVRVSRPVAAGCSKDRSVGLIFSRRHLESQSRSWRKR
jgi:hypothetical protein